MHRDLDLLVQCTHSDALFRSRLFHVIVNTCRRKRVWKTTAIPTPTIELRTNLTIAHAFAAQAIFPTVATQAETPT